MNRFWDIVMKPCLEAINAKNIVEIGSDNGYGTKNLINYCEDNKGTVTSIDPFPKYDYKQWENEHVGIFKLYTDLSLNRLPLLQEYDAILIDGDHNWYTVYNELKIIQNTFNSSELPLIFLHDINWPYARRDLYYNPDNIPVGYRQAYDKKGMLPNELNLQDEGGLNDHLNNAIYENNPQNGVLTAIEDFIDQYPEKDKINFINIPGFFGMGIIYNTEKHKNILNVINNKNFDKNILHKIEMERIDWLIKHKDKQKLNKQLAKDKEVLLNNQKNIEKDNQGLLNEKNILQKEKDRYININKILEKTISQMKLNNEGILDEKNILKDKYSEQLKEIEKLKETIKEKDKRINKLLVENKIHLNSIRYNLGDVIIRGMKPSINTIKMPIRIIRLFKQGIQKKKNEKKKLEINTENADISLKEKKICPGIKNTEQLILRSDIEEVRDKNYILNLQQNKNSIYEIEGNPIVSIIVVNHNGEKHLDNFFNSIIKNIKYKNFEIVIVDNASKDRSLEIIGSYSNKLNIKLIKNTNNESYSRANNQGAEIATGEYYLFANNDIQVFEGWLEQLLTEYTKDKNIGAVGSVLFYPKCPEDSINSNKSFTIQHCGIKFKKTKERIIPYNYLNGKSPSEAYNETTNISAVTGASLMVSKVKFLQVGGFTEEYIYGYEDVDFSLKLMKKGYNNYIVPSSMAFHFEFGTQEKQNKSAVSKRRMNNINVFKDRWEKWLDKKYNLSIFSKENNFFETKIKVAFAVTEAGDDVSAGDYFTAMEFGEAMKKRGWEIQFLKRKGPEDWYVVDDDIDVVITLLDAYDVRKIKCNNENLITIAWARNWFERWANQPYIRDYNYVLASSKLACEYMEKIIGRKVHLLQIGSNKDRFTVDRQENLELKCDYCFTGSYWNDPREIIDMLNPQKYSQYKFNIYGANWDKLDKFAPYNKGFVSYKTMPEIYASTKIVIDDANRVTKPFGSVNSRVFDALASGVLVITNGLLGAEYTFNNLLPTYKTEKELNDLIEYYLSNEEERIKLVKKLQTEVLEKHTYDVRVNELLEIMGYMEPKKKIIIKTPVPKAEVAEEWGDYHFALALIKEFGKLGYEAQMQYLNQWNDDDSEADIVMVLRGLNKYNTKNYHYNIMWNISHPDEITMDEYYSYDHTYIASKVWTEYVRENKKNDYTKIDVLLQCTDTSIFKPVENSKTNYELLFVGNSRKIYRKIIKDILPSKHDLAVYGTNWTGLIDQEYIKGENIPNKELYKHYGTAKIVLNDHWDDMREKGFISNRIFDVLACKSFIITDEVVGLDEYFGDSVISYKGKDDLKEKIDLYMNNEELRKKEIEKAYEIVVNNHTFEKRAQQIIEELNHKENGESIND